MRHATGVAICDLQLTPERVWRVITDPEAASSSSRTGIISTGATPILHQLEPEQKDMPQIRTTMCHRAACSGAIPVGTRQTLSL